MRTAKEMVDFCIEKSSAMGNSGNLYPHFAMIERNLLDDEEVLYAFSSVGVKDRKRKSILSDYVAVVCTNKKLMYAGKKLTRGDFLRSVNYDTINDISSEKWLFAYGTVIVDSLTEYMNFTVTKESVEKIRNAILEIIEDNQAKKNIPIAQNNPTSAADELRKYKELLDDGIISQEEFDQKKKQLLGL